MKMMKNNFVVAIKSNGKILREIKEDNNQNVYIPFGEEYIILLKNLDSRKAKVNISIDGNDVLNKQSLLINGNETVELKGYLKNNKVVNAFRFIEKTQEISEYRGDRIDDGIIRVEYTFEKVVTEPTYVKTMTFPLTGNPNWHNTVESLTRGMPTLDSLDGITVKGTEINQKFNYASIGELEEKSSVIVLNLKGKKEDAPIEQAITVDTKIVVLAILHIKE